MSNTRKRDSRGRFVKTAKVAPVVALAPIAPLVRELAPVLTPVAALSREVLAARLAPMPPVSPLRCEAGTVLPARRWVGKEWTPVGWMEGNITHKWIGTIALLVLIAIPTLWHLHTLLTGAKHL